MYLRRLCSNKLVWRLKYAIVLLVCVCGCISMLMPMQYKQISVELKFMDTNVHTYLVMTDICEKLIQTKNTTLIDQTKLEMKSHPRTVAPWDQFSTSTSNCHQYLTSKGFYLDGITQKELNFPIAFTVMVYKEVEQIERLLRAIYRPHNVYCIHTDSKSPTSFYLALQSVVSCLPNVFVSNRHLDVKWGTYSVLDQELLCLKDLDKHNVKWRYVINLTGQEYPLKTNLQLVQILQAYNGANDILGAASIINKDRVAGKPKPPHNITACKGPLHIAASRQFVNYVLYNQTALDFLKWCKLIGVPDETYFTSLNNNPHLNIPGSYTGDIEVKSRDFYTRYKIWYDKTQCGSGRFQRGICIQGIADLPALTKAPHMFVNKFDYYFEPVAYDCIEQWYDSQMIKERDKTLLFDTDIYKNSTIVKNSKLL